MNSITIDSLKNLFNPNIIDIREKYEYNKGCILNAYNVPYEKLLTTPEKYLLREKIYYIYCQKGIKSRKVSQILNNLGYNVIDILGGYDAYINS